MSTVTFRPDYAKFVFTVQAGTWHQYSERFHEASHTLKFNAEWLKSHKMNPWYGDVSKGTETWSVDIWGEWAGIVEALPIAFFPNLRRFDVRAVIWDCNEQTIIDVGQHLQNHITSHNINVFSTKPATKRLGRDRGGKGFAIGSHKSDLRVTVYKRTGEFCAQEFQCSGAMLKSSVELIWEGYRGRENVISPWRALVSRVQSQGEIRTARVFGAAGLGTYWPILAAEGVPSLPPIQSAFIPEVGATESDQG
jgi:hypothetical protein